MSTNLTITAVIFSVLIIACIVFLIVNKKIRVKYGLVWIMLFVLLLLFILIPGFLGWISDLIGFQTPANLVICLLIGVLVLISIVNTVINSSLNKNIRTIIKKLAIANKEIEDLKNNEKQ